MSGRGIPPPSWILLKTLPYPAENTRSFLYAFFLLNSSLFNELLLAYATQDTDDGTNMYQEKALIGSVSVAEYILWTLIEFWF